MINLFTEAEVKAAKKIVLANPCEKQASLIQSEILTGEVMQRIAIATMQENDPRYMAYRLLYHATSTQEQQR